MRQSVSARGPTWPRQYWRGRDEMTAQLLDGRALARDLLAELVIESASLRAVLDFIPTLAIVVVGEDPASRSYITGIERATRKIGFACRVVRLEASADAATLRSRIQELNADRDVVGVIIQLPLPGHLPVTVVSDTLCPQKDIDGITPTNAGRLALGLPAMVPNTPLGGMELLRHHGIDPAGKHAVVVGRSSIVGKPMALLLLADNATVTLCHRHTRDLPLEVGRGDIVVAAAGHPGLVTGAMLKPGAVVVDFGVNFPDEAGGAMRGDVHFESAVEVAGAITPVPGGTGPVTNAMLLRNALRAARLSVPERLVV